jgi:hypothetical protein
VCPRKTIRLAEKLNVSLRVKLKAPKIIKLPTKIG